MKRTRSLSCKNKRSYPTKREAMDAFMAYRRQVLGGVKTNASVYKCSDHYHWGHYRNRKR